MQESERDYHNFSTSSSHRLPTISGTQAVRNAIRNSKPISTGLPSLDTILDSHASIERTQCGLRRGTVTEIFGPPGVGKTSFVIQAAVNTLRSSSEDHSRVVWIDTASRLLPGRFNQILEGYGRPLSQNPPSSPQPGCKENDSALLRQHLTHLQITNLPSLLVLFMHSVAEFPPPGTSLVILDDLSNFILSSLPRAPNIEGAASGGKSTTSSVIRNDHAAKQIIARRFQILSSLASALQAFAAARNLSVLITSKATVSLKAGQKAALRPALSSQQWDSCLGTRILLYRDFWSTDLLSQQAHAGSKDSHPGVEVSSLENRDLRLAKVLRLNGKEVSSPEVGFLIDKNGLREVIGPSSQVRRIMLPLATQPIPDLEGLEADGVEYDAVASPNDDSPQIVEPEYVDRSKNPALESEPELEPAKRKAIEISDSEDDGDQDRATTLSQTPSLPPDSSFRPASQANQALDPGRAGSQTAKRLRIDQVVPDAGVDSFQIESSAPDQNEEMLLDKFEAQRRPFSQAAADMSDPLTPSDYTGPSP